MFKLKNKKGVSPVIAVVLMVAVAVALAVIIYAWASGYISGEVGKAKGSTSYNFVIEEQTIDTSDNSLITVSLRNTSLDASGVCGTTSFAAVTDGFDWYENGTYKGMTGLECAGDDGDGTWEKGEVWQFRFDRTTGAWVSGDEIKLVHTISGYEMLIIVK